MIDVTNNLELAKRLEATGYYKIVTTGDEGPNGEDLTTHELDYVSKEWVRRGGSDVLLLDFEMLRCDWMSFSDVSMYKRVIILHSLWAGTHCGRSFDEVAAAEAIAVICPVPVEFRCITDNNCFDDVPADCDYHIHYDTVNNSDVLIDELDFADDFFNYFGV